MKHPNVMALAYLYLFLLLRSVFMHLTLPSFFGDRVSGTEFRGPDLGIRESRFVQSTYLYFDFLSSLDITFLVRGPGFGDRVSGTGFWGPNFGDRISGTGFRNQEAKSNQFFSKFEICSVFSCFFSKLLVYSSVSTNGVSYFQE